MMQKPSVTEYAALRGIAGLMRQELIAIHGTGNVKVELTGNCSSIQAEIKSEQNIGFSAGIENGVIHISRMTWLGRQFELADPSSLDDLAAFLRLPIERSA